MRTGIIIIAVAIVLGIVALLTLDVALVIAIGNEIGFGLSALAVGVAVVIVAGILAGFGIRRITGIHIKRAETLGMRMAYGLTTDTVRRCVRNIL